MQHDLLEQQISRLIKSIVKIFVSLQCRLNLEEKMFNVSVKLPNMLVNGQYTLDMKVLVLRISGQGDFDLNLGECNTQSHCSLTSSVMPGTVNTV